MTSPLIASALARWGLTQATCQFVAGRENQVFRVTDATGEFALRLRRPGLRSPAELRSELEWLDAMARAGLSVPRPKPSRAGNFLEAIEGTQVDLLAWRPGRPLGTSREPLRLENPEAVFFTLGQDIARLHQASDAFAPKEGFTRLRWDIEGLLGEVPLWGRFWDNPSLAPETRSLLVAFRQQARHDLTQLAGALDFGLTHADLVRENVLLDGDQLHLIDFDDGGYGFRLFDIATALFKNRKEPAYEALKSALIAGYRSKRPLDTAPLDLFLALRAVTYVGWIIPRMSEAGAPERNRRFIYEARDLCAAYLAKTPDPKRTRP
ncbi:phosphotransferase enzyme family protein [Phaeobacter sp. HF9A]|uniref:phosphotransferase enzyme family protein n=1 Tax=Phaeobacter sp. HF9A TaxID=2721561 RepID=UPI0014318FE6|nr:homoserine kinase [Phaeobacter sp. HF9A]NIZ13154.1 homoserine kinase [Phaeobacter sp. HF9A]